MILTKDTSLIMSKSCPLTFTLWWDEVLPDCKVVRTFCNLENCCVKQCSLMIFGFSVYNLVQSDWEWQLSQFLYAAVINYSDQSKGFAYLTVPEDRDLHSGEGSIPPSFRDARGWVSCIILAPELDCTVARESQESCLHLTGRWSYRHAHPHGSFLFLCRF